jgi:hypothetical protein
MILTVTLSSLSIWEAYYYGYGDVLTMHTHPDGTVTVVVNYGTDRYRAECQAARFASGLYFATLTDNDDNEVCVCTMAMGVGTDHAPLCPAKR